MWTHQLAIELFQSSSLPFDSFMFPINEAVTILYFEFHRDKTNIGLILVASCSFWCALSNIGFRYFSVEQCTDTVRYMKWAGNLVSLRYLLKIFPFWSCLFSTESLKKGKSLCCQLNHFSMTGRCSGPAHYDVSIRQAATVAFITSSFRIFLTQTFPRCGGTCYILPLRTMSQRFNGVDFMYRSVEVYWTFCSYLRVLVRIRNFYNVRRYYLHWRFVDLCFRPFIW